MPCPLCSRVYCDHTPEERGQQTGQEIDAELRADGEGGWDRVEQVNRECGIQTKLIKDADRRNK